jgi:hypothetical protein
MASCEILGTLTNAKRWKIRKDRQMLTRIETLDEPLLREKQAAEILNVSMRCLQMWRFKGVGPRWRKLSAAVRYAPSDLRDFADAGARGGDGQAEAGREGGR